MYRAIWATFLILSLYFITALLGAVDSWSMGAAVPGSDVFCRGGMLREIELTRVPMCGAIWFQEAKSWTYYLFTTLAMLRFDEPGLLALARCTDVAVFVAGGLAGAVALAIFGANVMTRLALITLEGLRTLVHGFAPNLGLPR